VSSARDSGSCRTEASLITGHLAYWLDVLAAMIPGREPRVELSVFDNPVLAERLADTIRPGLGKHAAFLIDNPERTRGRGYYGGFGLRITAEQDTVELGDGGLTSWTAQLTQDAKERCLVSCIATERLTALCGDG
jgi:hypothetical protein